MMIMMVITVVMVVSLYLYPKPQIINSLFEGKDHSLLCLDKFQSIQHNVLLLEEAFFIILIILIIFYVIDINDACRFKSIVMETALN